MRKEQYVKVLCYNRQHFAYNPLSWYSPNTTFQKLDLLLSTGKKIRSIPTQLDQLRGTNLDQWTMRDALARDNIKYHHWQEKKITNNYYRNRTKIKLTAHYERALKSLIINISKSISEFPVMKWGKTTSNYNAEREGNITKELQNVWAMYCPVTCRLQDKAKFKWGELPGSTDIYWIVTQSMQVYL
jgi:hypothetical protein